MKGQRVYRIVSNKYPPFDGGGAYRWGSRWVDPGRLVVHAASSYSLAVLENLVHWQSNTLPPTLVCIVATIPDSLKQSTKTPRDIDDEDACRAIGNKWFDEGKSVALWVPSVVSPYEKNVLINQLHPDFTKIRILKPAEAVVDKRLTR
ncbi:MAG: RES family NAD+ phosphorylase [Granulosicoccus sp.]